MSKNNNTPQKITFKQVLENIKYFLNDIEILKTVLVPIHKTGIPFIIIFALISLIIGSFSDFLGWLGLLLTMWCVYFFRDPKRITPKIKNTFFASADGKVLPIKLSQPPTESGINKKMNKISTFMNVFNVHVNRIPIDGKISKLSYVPGAFFNASLDKASEDNEKMVITMEIEKNLNIVIVQIAGLIARRIKCDLKEGQQVKAGEKFGIIRFGSRVDVYLPDHFDIKVLEGQTMIGGETFFANYKSKKHPSSELNTLKKK